MSFGRVGRYELIAQLATGGMGEVFLARTRGLAGFEKLVVIKRALPALVKSDRHHLLFAEARLAATLSHANIVQVHDVGREDESVFIAMEFLHGQDVRSILRRQPAHRLPLAHALAIAQSVCAGLHYAHEKRDTDGGPLGIVHRDVSPSNVFVTYDGAVKLIDFGIAKATTLPSETQQGTVKGKPGYMSPEQCRGEPLDRRSDIFCVGILLYEMTTGRSPFVADTEYLTYQHIIESTPPSPSTLVPDYPAALESLLLQILHKHRRDRPATALAIQEQLAAIARDLELDTSALALQRHLASLFTDELASWHAAQAAGTSLEDHVIRRTTTTIEQPAPPTPAPVPVRHRRRRTLVTIAGVAAIGLAAAVTLQFVGHAEQAGQAPAATRPSVSSDTGQAPAATRPSVSSDTGQPTATRPSVSSDTGQPAPGPSVSSDTGQMHVPDTGHAGQARVRDKRPTGRAGQKETTKAGQGAAGSGSGSGSAASAVAGSGSAQPTVLGPDDLL